MLFERILLPLPSEYFPENAVKRAIQLSAKFKSKLILQYIFEEQVLDKVNNVTSGAVTCQSLDELVKEVKHVEVHSESTVLFEQIENMAKKKNIDIEIERITQNGVHSDEILGCIQKESVDLMVTEFHRDTLLKYRIFYNSPIPIWLEHNGKNINKIYGILTNLSPNVLVPKFALKLTKKFNVPLHIYYVLDNTEPYDENIEKTERKKLFSTIEQKFKSHGLKYDIDLVTQDISNFLGEHFKHKEGALVILGRFKKPAKIPFIRLDKKIEVSKKLGANVLILK